MFMFDIESLDIESTAIVLSAAITHFEFDIQLPSDKLKAYHELVNRSCFVKFNAKEQTDSYKRTLNKDTLNWWKSQADIPKELSLKPQTYDMTAIEGIEKIKKYIDDHGGRNQICWARGSLDQMAFDSLCRAVDVKPLFEYNMWRDMRTAIDLLATNSNGGYCNIDGFDYSNHVVKHDPRNDCALDIMMLLYHV